MHSSSKWLSDWPKGRGCWVETGATQAKKQYGKPEYWIDEKNWSTSHLAISLSLASYHTSSGKRRVWVVCWFFKKKQLFRAYYWVAPASSRQPHDDRSPWRRLGPNRLPLALTVIYWSRSRTFTLRSLPGTPPLRILPGRSPGHCWHVFNSHLRYWPLHSPIQQ